MRRHTYGWKPDLPDQRDHLFAAPLARAKLPDSVDLRPGCTPVEDQGQLGSCTGNAIAGAMEFLHRKETKRVVNFSRLFIYYQERKLEGTIDQDAGAQIRDGIKALAKVGVCKEYLYPYNVERFKHPPSIQANADAAKHKIVEYRRVRGLYDMRAALAGGTPVVFGFTVYDSFESDAVAKSGKVPMPGAHERVQGGHAVLAVGYDEAAAVVICRNSWGKDWGDKGYFYLPYGYVTNRDLSDDFWTVTQ
jgi:C1A family cysteine protease